jgi:peptide-methionine (R)-S-oxide reductase
MLLGASALAVGVGVMRWLPARSAAPPGPFPVNHTEDEWRKILSPEAYAVLREEATEKPGTSALLNEHRAGTFVCAGCDNELFSSETKFESGTGWPSFWQPLEGGVGTAEDTSLFMLRTSVHCADCGGHLGHVFDDGPRPTRLRYCINGVAMNFRAGAVG